MIEELLNVKLVFDGKLDWDYDYLYLVLSAMPLGKMIKETITQLCIRILMIHQQHIFVWAVTFFLMFVLLIVTIVLLAYYIFHTRLAWV